MYVVTYRTESGDDGVLGIWEYLPSQDDIDAVAKDKLPDEYEAYEDDPDFPAPVFTIWEHVSVYV